MLKKLICLIFLIFLLISLMFTACSSRPESYQFPNKEETIVSIEMLQNNNKNNAGIDETNFYLIRKLSVEEIDPFMNKLYALETKRDGYPPSRGYGKYMVRITYANGNIEIFGVLNIEHIEKGKKPTGIGLYLFPGKAFENLFLEYANPLDLPPLP